MATRAIEASRSYDYETMRDQARRILAYARGNTERDAVVVARFILAHLAIIDADYRRAARLLEPTAEKPLYVRAAAHNNLGVVRAHLRNPIAAIREFQAARQDDPYLLIADLNLRNLATTLIAERAPVPAGFTAWPDIQREAADRLRRLAPATVREFLDPDRAFPAIQVLHLLVPGDYFPRISTRLAPSPVKRRAACHLLQSAQDAMSDAQYHQAMRLVERAVEVSPTVRSESDVLASWARAKIEELGSLEEAMAYTADVQAADRVSDGISLVGKAKVAAILRSIDHSEWDSAAAHLVDLVSVEPNARRLAQLKTRMEAARAIRKACGLLQGHNLAEAIECLCEAIRHEPANREALAMLLSAELLASPLRGEALAAAAKSGESAIKALGNRDLDTCRRLCVQLENAMPGSRFARHLSGAEPDIPP